MKRNLFLFLPALFLAKTLFAQTPIDTTHPPTRDSLQKTVMKDSNLLKQVQYPAIEPIKDSNLIQNKTKKDSSALQLINLPIKNSGATKKVFPGKELLFYVLIILLLFFAFLKNVFPKYFGDLFRLFFRTTLKQRQIREQLMQTTLPSLAFNLFFVITAAMYIDLLLQHFNLLPVKNFWLLFLYCLAGLSIMYLLKFVGLKISGWLFNMKNAAEAYIFIVFIINKMMGIYLLPFLILLSFTEGNLYHVFLILSWIGLAMLFIYRFILTFGAVHNQIKVNLFHFFLYLCAFEIVPLLLIYKLLVYFFQ